MAIQIPPPRHPYSEPWDITRIPNLKGKVAIVTGANSPESIGFHMAYHLAVNGAKVYIGARSQEKALEGIEAMKKRTPSSARLLLGSFVADIGEFEQVDKATKAFLQAEDRLDILINNAAIAGFVDSLDKNGISNAFAVNHLGPFLLTIQLLPLLKKTASADPSSDVRVVTISSDAYYSVPPDVRFRNLDDFNVINYNHAENPVLRYGYSKLANILFARQLQKNLDAEGSSIISISLHPGRIATAGALKHLGTEVVEALKDTHIITLEQGAHTALLAATDPVVREKKGIYGGRYLIPFGIFDDELSPTALDDNLAKELWETSERVIKDAFGTK